MIVEEKINGLIFVAQTTYYVFKSEEHRANDDCTLVTSEWVKFEANKDLARKNERINADNKFIVF